MSASTVSELLHSLEQTIRDRFQVVNEVLRGAATPPFLGNVTQAFPPQPGFEALMARLAMMEARLQVQDNQISELRALVRSFDRPELLPKIPMDGLEVRVKEPIKEPIKTESEVKVFMVPAPVAKAAPVPVPVAAPVPVPVAAPVPVPVAAPVAKAAPVPVAAPVAKAAAKAQQVPEPEIEEEVEEAEEAEELEEEVEELEEEVEELEEEVEELEEEVEEADAVELTAFDYKGITYYRDSDNNVYAEEDGEVSDEPFGIWNEVRQRILARK